MSDKMPIEKKKVITPKFRVSYPNVFTAKDFEGDGNAVYSLTMIFDKATDIKAMREAAKNAAIEKWGADPKAWPKFRYPLFNDGDESGKPEQKGCIVVRASSKNRPGVVDQGKKPMVETDGTFYAGCFARASVIASAYDHKGNRGIKFSLQNIQKLADGQPFSGRRSAEEEFDAVEGAEVSQAEPDDSFGGF